MSPPYLMGWKDKLSKTHKIILSLEDIGKLKKHRYLRLGNNLLIVDELPINQVKIYGETTVE